MLVFDGRLAVHWAFLTYMGPFLPSKSHSAQSLALDKHSFVLFLSGPSVIGFSFGLPTQK